MEFMNMLIDETQIYLWELALENWFFVLSLAFLGFELLRLAAKKLLSWNMIGDTVANFATQIAFIAITFLIVGTYVGIFFYAYENWSFSELPINGWTIVVCIILADIAYYWEHRFVHRFGLGWATHAVHHSSPYFNISVAYRFGPLDGIMPLFFHLPLVLMGFHPFVVFFAEIVVQLYQTALHTEVIRKFPRPIEVVFNTPSHHRVHHGSNPQYLDKNYGGIFILWDRMFGTFEEEKEKVVYGVTEPINSVNPVVVFFCGFIWLGKRVARVPGVVNKLKALVMPPDWEPEPETALEQNQPKG